MRSDEMPEEAMFRELEEETGLTQRHVEIVAATHGWLRYRLPDRYVRRHQRPTCIGQKQVWFLLRLLGNEDALQLDASAKPEFDLWRWVDFWYPAAHVVNFKRQVYERALRQFAPLVEDLFSVELGTLPPRPAADAPQEGGRAPV
jgi:putative (di)nucleoside polyphosphate hydrolase